jgi:hypothetical protein
VSSPAQVRSHGSKAWVSGVAFDLRTPAQPTKFERLIARLGLADRPDLWPHHAKVRQFVKRNKYIRFIPEWLIDEIGGGLYARED